MTHTWTPCSCTGCSAHRGKPCERFTGIASVPVCRRCRYSHDETKRARIEPELPGQLSMLDELNST